MQAVMNGPIVRPRFQVEKLVGKLTRTIFRYKKKKIGDKYTNERVEERKEVPAGFLVYTAKGDVFRVPSKAELKRLGFDQPAALIDMDSGDTVQNMQPNLKQLAMRHVSPHADIGLGSTTQGDE